MTITILSILFSTILGVAGQLLLSHGMKQMGALEFTATALPSVLLRIATSPWIIGGLLVYASGTFFWLMVLNRTPLSYSYPFISLGILLGTLAAWGIFHEHVPPLRWIGLLVVCSGVLIVGFSQV